VTQSYLACLFDSGMPETIAPRLDAALKRHGCVQRPSRTGMLLFAGNDLPLRTVADGHAILIGHLFECSGQSASPDIAVDLSPDGMGAMTERLWGSYVMLGFSDGGRVHAFRDPSGGLACYHARLAGVHYFTSVPHLLVDCGLLSAELDWTVIEGALVRHSARSAETAIRAIDELLPGTLLSGAGDRIERRQIWDPWRHASATPAEEPAEALRKTLCSSLGAWGRSFQRPLIEISGGLDSAIVAAGLSPAAPGTSLITFAAAPGDPDETAYAKAIAEHLALPLEIVVPRTEDVDLGRSLSSNLPRPNARAFTQAADAQSLRHAGAIGADAFVSGGGGDDIFCYLRTVLPAVDRLQAEGVRAMLASAMDVAVMNHSTLWDALARILRRLVRGGPSRSRLDLRFIAPEAASAACAPVIEVKTDRTPGKSAHVRGIMTIHNYLEGHARSDLAPILSPLLSQRIVECCLSIPTWQWCENGRNRAVARRAFQGRLPPIVLERRSKGCFDGFCASLFDSNRELVRAMLLEGRLAEHGLLDLQALEAAIRNPSPSAETVARLLALVDVESWIGSWIARPAQRA
jgi:asparagine synthase (glutamine-hydrolysing)